MSITTISDLTRWEAINLLLRVNEFIEQRKWGSVMLALGMDDDLFPEGMSLDELMEICSVRLTILAQRAGVEWDR